MMKEEIHIGNLMKNKLKEDGRSAGWLAKKINYSRSNIYDVFKRDSVSVEQVLEISLAMKENLSAYISEYLKNKTKYTPPKMCCIELYNEISIGSLIKKTFEDGGHSISWLANKANCTPNSMRNIFKSKTLINTAQLINISIALKTDFFEYFSSKYKYLESKTDNIEMDPHKCTNCSQSALTSLVQ